METSGGVSKSRLLSQAKNSTLEYDNLKIELEEWYYYFTFFFFMAITVIYWNLPK